MSASVLLVFLCFFAGTGSAFQARELTREEAIELAEAAVVRNGCTDLTPIKDRPQLANAQPKVDFKFLMDHELDCRAIRALAGSVSGKFGWIIVFSVRHRYPEMPLASRDRLILMDRDGGNLRLESRRNQIKRILKENS